MRHHAFPLITILLTSFAFAAGAAAQSSKDAKPAPAVDAVRVKVVNALNAGNAQAFFKLLNAEMRQVLPEAKARDFVTGVRTAKGKITAAKATSAGPNNAKYLLTAEKGEWALSLDLDEAGLISGLLITNPPATPPPAATSQVPQPSSDKASAAVAVAPAVDAVRVKVVAALNAGDTQAFFKLLNTEMRQVLPEDKAGGFLTGVRNAKGKITAAKPTSAGPNKAKYLFTAEKGEWELSLELDDAGLIAGLLITNPPAPPPPVATSQIPLGLPFKGRWLVFWGGDTAKVNHHVNDKGQRRAADLVVTGPDGKSYRTDGKLNADYFAYGQEILAVADGKVIVAIDGVPDNLPGAMNPYLVTGNMVIIEHDPKLFSAYCHLQRGTVQVKLDQRVQKGQLLGLCGNSGHSSEPHLHFQLQDGPHFESAYGIEPVFDNVSVTRNGSPQTIAKYRFLKGDLIDASK